MRLGRGKERGRKKRGGEKRKNGRKTTNSQNARLKEAGDSQATWTSYYATVPGCQIPIYKV